MGCRASAKLLTSFTPKYNNKGLPQEGLLQLEASHFNASHEALQRQVMALSSSSSSSYAFAFNDIQHHPPQLLHEHSSSTMHHHHPFHIHRGTTVHYHHHIQCRTLCDISLKAVDDPAHKADGDAANQCPPNAAAWEALIVQTEHAKLGGAKPVEALKALLDELEPFAAADDIRMAAAYLCIADFYAFKAFSEQEPVSFLQYAQKAQKVYSSLPKSMEHAQCLYILGYAHLKLEELETAHLHLEQCALALKQLKVPGYTEYLSFVKLEVQIYLGQAKMGLRKHLEAHTHFLNFIEIKEKSLKPGHPELAASYLRIARCYHKGGDLDVAMNMSYKAFEIYMRGYGPSSLQVAEVRRLMSEIYYKFGKYKECLSENEAARPILEYLGKTEEVAASDLESAECLVHLEKFNESITMLKEVIKNTSVGNISHVLALVTVAKVYVQWKRDDSAAEYCKRARDILEKREATFHTAGILVLLAMVYEKRQKFEHAIEVYKRAKEISDKCSGHQAADMAARIEGLLGALLLMMERYDEALPYLESRVTKERSIRDLKCKEVLGHHVHLGVAYSRVQRLKEALEQFETARRISCEGLIGGDQSMLIVIHNHLARTYLSLDRLKEALGCQKVLVDLLKGNKFVEVDVSVEEAETTLEALQQKAEICKSSQRED
eukprot:c20388_g1_i1 orf=160-2148(-)